MHALAGLQPKPPDPGTKEAGPIHVKAAPTLARADLVARAVCAFMLLPDIAGQLVWTEHWLTLKAALSAGVGGNCTLRGPVPFSEGLSVHGPKPPGASCRDKNKERNKHTQNIPLQSDRVVIVLMAWESPLQRLPHPTCHPEPLPLQQQPLLRHSHRCRRPCSRRRCSSCARGPGPQGPTQDHYRRCCWRRCCSHS